MHVGLIHFMAYPETMKGDGPILETLKKIALDEYFDVVAVSWIRDSTIRKKAREMLKMAKMHVVYGAHPALLTQSLNPNDLEETGRQRAVAELKKASTKPMKSKRRASYFSAVSIYPPKERRPWRNLSLRRGNSANTPDPGEISRFFWKCSTTRSTRRL